MRLFTWISPFRLAFGSNFRSFTMFALVKYRNDGKIVALPVQDIYVVVKKDGLKTFEPFEPAGVSDFSHRHKKYVVFSEKDDILRRWYITIGCLGASPKKVLKRASKVHWSCQGDSKVSLSGDNPEEMPNAEELAPVNSTNVPTILRLAIECRGCGMQDVPKTDVELSKLLAATEKAISLHDNAIKYLEEQLKATISRVDMHDKILANLDNIMESAFTSTITNVLSKLHPSIKSSIDIKEAGNATDVLKWVNTIPTDLSKAISDEDEMDVPLKEKKDDSSDDTLQNLSENSYERQNFWRNQAKEAMDGSTATDLEEIEIESQKLEEVENDV